jgi:large subunit ribosomal protein L36e
MAKSQPINIALGKNKGHKTTKIQGRKPRPVSTKAKIGKRTKLVRQIISQVAGVSGYEKRVI